MKDKRTGRTYQGLHVFEDGGDAGDEYTYSWPARDRKVSLDPASVSVSAEGTASFPAMVDPGRRERAGAPGRGPAEQVRGPGRDRHRVQDLSLPRGSRAST